MTVIRTCALPDRAFLRKYARGSGYTDCYITEMAGEIPFAAYVEAFYTTWLFKLERALLALAAKPATDLQAKELAAGTRTAFAAWSVEEHTEDQLLMCDITARTRSWFMTAPIDSDSSPATRLYFGSAITTVRSKTTGRETIGLAFQALTGFHKLYSRALLRAARARLEDMRDMVSK